MLTLVVAPTAPGPQGAPAQLGAASRDPARGAGRDVGCRRRVRGRERCGFAARPQRLSLDRRRRAGRARPDRLSGRHAVAGQLRAAGPARPRVRDPAVVDLHPRVDRAADQRGAPGDVVRAVPGPVAAAGRPGASGLRARLPSLADLPRSQHLPASRPAGRAGRLSHLRRHGGFHARLRARRPRCPDRGAADGGAGRLAGDDRQAGPAERALVQGRARRRALPGAAVAVGADGVQLRAARPSHRQQGRRVAHRRGRVPGGRLHGLAPGLPVLRPPGACSSSASRSRRSRWG